MRRLLLFSVCFLTVSCSTQPRTDNQEAQRALEQMVLDKSAFDRHYLNYCSSMQQCQAPLVCMNQRCDIPPSLLGQPSDNTPTLTIINGDVQQKLWLEICDDDYTRARGMMLRKAFAQGWGMLFIFDNDAKRSFWMANCYLPLDMVFIRKVGSVSNVIENAEPLNTEPRYQSTDRVRYVLELPPGSIRQYGIHTATKFVLPR
jgi:uncharacterized membrane protein (UPF0127 family)